MPEDRPKITICHCLSKNKKNILPLFNSINYCIKCNSFIFGNLSSFELTIKVIKPNNYGIKEENLQNLQWLTKDCKADEFVGNYSRDYLKIRSKLVKNIKKICSFFSLSLKTYFSSISYLDKICFKLCLFNESTLIQISLFCIILATKFFEKKKKAFEVQAYLKENTSKNYNIDEIYALKLLNYDLNVCTPYDILMDILYLGFVFENEGFINYNRLNILYKNIPKILYIFSESSSYINMTSKQIAICMIGFFRELLGLNPFSENIRNIFMINSNNEAAYISGLNIIKKKIKIE